MRRNKWLWALAVALLTPMVLATSAQAAPSGSPAGSSVIEQSTAAPHGSIALAIVDEATAKTLEPKLRNGSTPVGTAALCNQQSYVQVFDPATGQRLITLAPGNTINVHAFTVLRHQGVVYPNTRAIFFYRWNSNSAGFDYYTTFAGGNCVINEEPNSLSAQYFPTGTPVTVSVCFIPWEIGQVICGQLGFINRTF